MKAMAKEPRDRFMSYDEFRMALERSRSMLLLAQTTQGPGSPKSKTSWWRR
jgi:hypothetical protein